jgi:hypothetical protein
VQHPGGGAVPDVFLDGALGLLALPEALTRVLAPALGGVVSQQLGASSLVVAVVLMIGLATVYCGAFTRSQILSGVFDEEG